VFRGASSDDVCQRKFQLWNDQRRGRHDASGGSMLLRPCSGSSTSVINIWSGLFLLLEAALKAKILEEINDKFRDFVLSERRSGKVYSWRIRPCSGNGRGALLPGPPCGL